MNAQLVGYFDIVGRIPNGLKELRDGLLKVVKTAEIDPEMAAARCRKMLEYIVRRLCLRHYGKDPGGTPLVELIDRLVKNNHIPERVALHTVSVRRFGNA